MRQAGKGGKWEIGLPAVTKRRVKKARSKLAKHSGARSPRIKTATTAPAI